MLHNKLPRYVIDPSFGQKVLDYCDCIVIGSGIAGLSTAIRISRHTKIRVLTKSSLSESTTWYAQGGIAAAIKKPDDWEKHYKDTIRAGQGLSDPKAVKILVQNAPQMIEELIEIGINFDISEGEISLTTEGGHSYPRILHAGGDATGEEIENKLVRYAKSLDQIEIFPDYLALDVLTYNNRSIGVIGINLNENKIELHPTSNVIIASGGIGQLYELTTNPPVSTGDGIAMAYRGGAEIMDIEFVQFHPTVFKTKNGELFLISEALRGEGAYLRDCHGKRFMLGKHSRAELAPRDIVVKEMTKVMKETKCDFVYLDATHLPENLLKVRFPNIISKLKENGLDLKKDLIKVSPAAHYLNGGIKTDYDGKTNIDGLYACGEAAATGAHGANRLASNSLIEGLVFGWKIYNSILKFLDKKDKDVEEKISQKVVELTRQSKKSIDNKNIQHNIQHNKSIKQEPGKESELDIGLDIGTTIANFRHMMTEKVGILREEQSLKKAEDFIDFYLNNRNLYNQKDKKMVEFLNMLTVAKLIVKAANLRKESRGTHQRSDFPKKDDRNWKKHIILKKDEVYFREVSYPNR